MTAGLLAGQTSGRSGGDRAHGVDALRGIAAAGVVVVHAMSIRPLGVDFYSWHAGYFVLGVPLFFIISAFSMSLAYPLPLSSPGRILSYSIRRFLRIAPLFYFMIGAWIVGYLSVGGAFPSAERLFLNISFLFGFSPGSNVGLVPAGWSIGLEMIFYCLFPILWYKRGLPYAFGLLFSALIASFILNQVRGQPAENYFYWTHFVTNAPYFVFGLLIWCVYDMVPSTVRKSVGILCLALASLMLMAMFKFGPLVDGQAVRIQPVPIELVAGWGSAFALLVLSQAMHPIIILVNPVTKFLGKISYSLYLMHPLLIWSTGLTPWAAGLTDDRNLVIPVVALVTLAVAVPIAYVLYVTVEAPFISLARKLTAPRRDQATLHADVRHS
jgi:peptidoglycan/LPS O-acetylase OafA/YrhL